VASFDAGILRTVGVELVQKLWDCDISAELAKDARSPEDLLLKYRDDNHSWILMVKQDSVVKAKTMGRKDASDVDLPLTQVMSWLKSELRERDHREGTHHRQKLQRHTSATDTNSNHITEQSEQEVHVLMGGTKSKKSNRRNIVEQAQSRASAVVQSFLDGPIAAVETTDQVVELIRDTRLSDPESWRKVTHSVPTTERRYISEIHELLQELATRNKDITRNAFVYNFRTGLCVYYDLKA
jgi:translation initiation factor 2-alpha kinase 4